MIISRIIFLFAFGVLSHCAPAELFTSIDSTDQAIGSWMVSHIFIDGVKDLDADDNCYKLDFFYRKGSLLLYMITEEHAGDEHILSGKLFKIMTENPSVWKIYERNGAYHSAKVLKVSERKLIILFYSYVGNNYHPNVLFDGENFSETMNVTSEEIAEVMDEGDLDCNISTSETSTGLFQSLEQEKNETNESESPQEEVPTKGKVLPRLLHYPRYLAIALYNHNDLPMGCHKFKTILMQNEIDVNQGEMIFRNGECRYLTQCGMIKN